MMKLFRKVSTALLFSAYQHDSMEDDGENTRRVEAQLQAAGIGYKLVLGFFDGEMEQTFVVDGSYEDLVCQYLKEYNQQFGLYIDETRHAYKLDAEGNHEYFGSWQNLGRHTPDDGDFTYDPTTRCNYVVQEGGD